MQIKRGREFSLKTCFLGKLIYNKNWTKIGVINNNYKTFFFLEVIFLSFLYLLSFMMGIFLNEEKPFLLGIGFVFDTLVFFEIQ